MEYPRISYFFNPYGWLVVCHLCALGTGYCLYGDDPDCAFQCHCAVDSECSGGVCPSGCEGGPLGHNWRGPACQIGNIGLYKPANMTADQTYQKKYPASAAVDGVSPGKLNSSCAFLRTETDELCQWWTDLGDVYKIYNITIYGRTDCCRWRLQQFDLTVYNTSDNEVLCAYVKDAVRKNRTIECQTPVIGRYVHFKRKGGPVINLTPLCEVVITGNKYIDCQSCPSGVECNDITGCEACSGSYQPDCKQECEGGFHGTNCQQECGQCKNGTVCDRKNGTCPDGCRIWWTDSKCTTYIELPQHTNETVTIQRQTSNSIEIEWDPIDGISPNLTDFYGYLIEYKVDTMEDNYIEADSVSYDSNPYFKIDNLELNTWYVVKVTTFRQYDNMKEMGKAYDLLVVKTNCSEPSKPQNLNAISVADQQDLSTITLTWENILDSNSNCDNITRVSLFYKLTTSEIFMTVSLSPDVNNSILVLREKGEYQIKLVVENNEGYTSTSDIYTISIGVSESTSSPSAQVALTAGSVSGAFFIGIIVVIIVILVLLWRRRKANSSDQIHSFSNEACQHDLEQTEMNTVMDDRQEEKNESHVEGGELYETPNRNNDDHKSKQADSTQETKSNRIVIDVTTEEEGIYVNNDISIVSFEGYVARKKAKDELYKEYKTLPQPDLARCKIAVTKENKPKNRYHGIYAYDDTRVVLHGDDKPDYINATYITGYHTNKEYIATQGPKPSTWEDFWRMIWQEKSNRIVMVANLKEMGRNKVDPYWPEEVGSPLQFGAFTVTTEAEHRTADYTIRIMAVIKGNETRKIHQFHFTTWQDKDKPVHGIHTLLAFTERLRSFDKFGQGPLVVHCSAGVGRTGTFIALDILQQMATKEKTLDVYRCVQRLRNERMLMVQTKAQYVFLHDALIDFIKCGHKAIGCNEFQAVFATVTDLIPAQNVMDRIYGEIKLLNSLKNAEENSKPVALQDENISKNRNNNIIPDDTHRLYLSRNVSGNYINAVTVDSFKAHDSFVVTQMPFPHTMADFWQLIVEQECQAIVMLNTMDPQDETCVPYWPEKVNAQLKYGNVEVELLSLSHEEFLVVRDLKITEQTSRPSSPPHVLNIRQFQLLSWPTKEDLPPNKIHLLYLMEKLQSWQQQLKISADRWKPLIHCMDGGSHSGMFCGAMFLLDKMKIEQEVNAFLSARYVSTHRPQFFDKVHEYQFLYQIAIEYLTQHNEYANFR